MTEYAPAAIRHMFETIKAAIPSAVNAGIVGDSAHDYGYHRGRDYCTDPGDYSCQTPPDHKGDGQAACALDLSWSDEADQYAVSRRLLNAKNDSRMAAARSFFGSVDGVNVCGWDYYYGNACTSDDTHLWHVHLSILRQYANDDAALQRIASVITDDASTDGDDMPTQRYIYTAAGQVTRLAARGAWYDVHWDEALDYTGGASLKLPDAARYFASSAWLYCSDLPAGEALSWRIERVHDGSGEQEALFPVGELPGGPGQTCLCLSAVGSLPADTSLRLQVNSTYAGTTIDRAWWRVLAW
jgi:hypothetical protein